MSSDTTVHLLPAESRTVNRCLFALRPTTQPCLYLSLCFHFILWPSWKSGGASLRRVANQPARCECSPATGFARQFWPRGTWLIVCATTLVLGCMHVRSLGSAVKVPSTVSTRVTSPAQRRLALTVWRHPKLTNRRPSSCSPHQRKGRMLPSGCSTPTLLVAC